MSNEGSADAVDITRVKEHRSKNADGVFLSGKTYMHDGAWYAVMVPRDPFAMAWPVQCKTRKEADQYVREQLAKY